MYHTQECRRKQLSAPIICNRTDAWLGDGYYFWNDEVDAIHWGSKSKNRTGRYQIYKADIDCEDVLDTVFNESHYKFWVKQIEKAASHITKKTGQIATLREINQYISEKAAWSEVATGILFQDLPYSIDLLVANFNYRKRIQLAVFKLEIINNFALHLEMDCI